MRAHRARTIPALLTMAALSVAATGCATFVDRAVDRTVDKAANRVGEKVGKRVGDAVAGAILSRLNPAMMNVYTSSLLRVLFYQGGYYAEGATPYEPGQFTRWKASNLPQGDWFERTLLARHEDNTEWWRIESRDTTDGGKEMVLIMEALMSQPDAEGNRQVRRMRAKMPGESEPREIPVTEEDAKKWAITNNKVLTEESAQEMTVADPVLVSVPAGKYQARHIQMKGYEAQNRLDWFLSEEVPGSLIKYTSTVKDENGKSQVIWNMELLATGQRDPASKLGVDLTQGAATSEGGDEAAGDDAEVAPGDEEEPTMEEEDEME